MLPLPGLLQANRQPEPLDPPPKALPEDDEIFALSLPLIQPAPSSLLPLTPSLTLFPSAELLSGRFNRVLDFKATGNTVWVFYG